VNLGYVLNVIEDPQERLAALRRAWDLSRRLLAVAAGWSWLAAGKRRSSSGTGY